MTNGWIINLLEYDIDPVRGFLPPEDPLTELPEAFAPWEEMSQQIPAWLVAGKVGQMLNQLDFLDPESLQGKRELDRAFLVLSVMANAYIMGGEEQATVLPRNLAVPLWQVAQRLQQPPVFIYYSMMLCNWWRIDPSEPIALDNLAVSRCYQGSLDERWFYLIMVVIEAVGGSAVRAIAEVQRAIALDDAEAVEQGLQDIIAAQEPMLATLSRMGEKCDPYIFYHRVRPILGAWKDPGVIYEGVSETPQMWIAASAAQSSLIQALDIALGSAHQNGSGAFLRDMRHYMPLGHRRFLATLEAGASLREYVMAKQGDRPGLKELYNHSVELLDAFRKKHLEISVQYVVKQARKSQNGVSGTSGTNVTRFLGQVRRETAELVIP